MFLYKRHHPVRGFIHVLLAGFFLAVSPMMVSQADAETLPEIRAEIDALNNDAHAALPRKVFKDLRENLDDARKTIKKAIAKDGDLKYIKKTRSKVGKFQRKLDKLVRKRKVSHAVADPILMDAESIVDQLTDHLGVLGGPTPPGVTAEAGAIVYATNYCQMCHGDNGSGGPSNENIQSKSAASLLSAFASEAVHQGLNVSVEEAMMLSEFLDGPVPLPIIDEGDFGDPERCRICHPRQYAEWQGTMMGYAAISPTFNALETVGNHITGGALAHNSAVSDESDLFCQRCHNPSDSFDGTLPEYGDMFKDGVAQPTRDFASDVGKRGISCDVCHQVSAPNLDRMLTGDLGDGISNAAFILSPGDVKNGPISDPAPNPVHASTNSEYLSSSEFCGSCHDVRPRFADVVEGTDFQRLEDLFTEWKNGPFGPINNTVGGVVSCQDCHMDAGPPYPAATYPTDTVSIFPEPNDAPKRSVSTHYFTGVDIALVPFPGQDDAGKDSHGYTIGQKQRREELLQSAAELSVSAMPLSGDVLPVDVGIANVGTGHNLPSGFSQERQMWIELTITDGNGDVVYESGYLRDSAHPETGEMAADGRLHDEDLNNLLVTQDIPTGAVIDIVHLGDFNQRHDHPEVNLGLANFGNEFLELVDGHLEEVFTPFQSQHVDNSHSIPALETKTTRYDVPVPSGTAGPLTINTRLLFRAFPPRFLRHLAQARPDLVTEEMIDRNLVVEMEVADPVIVAVP